MVWKLVEFLVFHKKLLNLNTLNIDFYFGVIVYLIKYIINKITLVLS